MLYQVVNVSRAEAVTNGMRLKLRIEIIIALVAGFLFM